MYSLRKFSNRVGNIGQPLPDLFPMFTAERIRFRHGATSLIAGAPGSYKSVLALNMLAKWCAQDATALYFSADSDEFTVAKRMGAMLTGDSTEQFEAAPHLARYTEALAAVDSAAFVYRSVDMETVQAHMHAFEAIHGDFPDVVFVDNLMNMVDDPTDWGGMIRMILDLDILARETRSHVCVLHHASESWAKDHPGAPPPSWAIQGKVSQIPRLVLTVAATDSTIRIACVKNTNGPQDPRARNVMDFTVQSSLLIEDPAYYVN